MCQILLPQVIESKRECAVYLRQTATRLADFNQITKYSYRALQHICYVAIYAQGIHGWRVTNH